jgi:hypothetical protein
MCASAKAAPTPLGTGADAAAIGTHVRSSRVCTATRSVLKVSNAAPSRPPHQGGQPLLQVVAAGGRAKPSAR